MLITKLSSKVNRNFLKPSYLFDLKTSGYDNERNICTEKLTHFKGPITWWVAPRLTGLKFQTGFWNKSSENQVVDYMERDSARGAIQPGLKILARYSQTGLGFFSPAKRAEKSM